MNQAWKEKRDNSKGHWFQPDETSLQVSYSDPSDRPVELRGYDLLQDEIPLWGNDSGATEPLNGVRWMVYRHPNKVNHALVFRGTVDRLDMEYDAHLLTKGLADHKLMMNSAAWTLRAMLFLEKRAQDERDTADGGVRSADPPGDRRCLKFWVAGHSLGGATVSFALSNRGSLYVLAVEAFARSGPKA